MRHNNVDHLSNLPLYGFAIGVGAVITGKLFAANIIMLNILAWKVLPIWSEGPSTVIFTACRGSLTLARGVIFGALVGATWNQRQNPPADVEGNASPSFN